MSIDRDLYESFRDIGRDIYLGQLTTSHGGNMSVRAGDRIIIKRRGARLGDLKPDDLIEVQVDRSSDRDPLASSDLLVHRSIYQQTDKLAVIHAHLRTATALSLSREQIIPLDLTGRYALGDVPVISAVYPATPEMAAQVAEALREQKIVMLRGHGCVSTGETLDRAFMWLSMLEEVSDIILRAHLLTGRAGE